MIKESLDRRGWSSNGRELMSLSSSALINTSKSIRNSVLQEFSLLLKRHKSDFVIKTVGEVKSWLEQLDLDKDSKDRVNALLNITSTIEMYDIQEIVVIWVRATRLLEGKLEETELRLVLELLDKCCAHCGSSDSVRLTFYLNVIYMCCNQDEKVSLNRSAIENSMGLFFSCLDGLTLQGTDTDIFEQDKTMNLSQFLGLCLENILKFNTKTTLSFLCLLNDCLRNASLSVNGMTNIVECAQRASDTNVLISCLHTIDIVISNDLQGVTELITADLVYLMTSAINVNNKLNQQVMRILDVLIQSKHWDIFWKTFTGLIENCESLINLRGAVTVLTDLALQNKEDWLFWLRKLFLSGNSMFGQILECINVLINDETFSKITPACVWFQQGDSIGLLQMFATIVFVEGVRLNNPNTIASVHESLLESFFEETFETYGFQDEWNLLRFVLKYYNTVTESQLYKLASNLQLKQKPLPRDILDAILDNMSLSSPQAGVFINYFNSTLLKFDRDSQNKIMNTCLPFMLMNCSRSIFIECGKMLIKLSNYTNSSQLLDLVETYLMPKRPRRKSIVSISIESPKDKWKFVEQAKVLVILFQFNLSLFPIMIQFWQQALKVKDVEVLLVLARILMKMRLDAKGCFYFSKEIDIDGLSATFQRNLITHPELKRDKLAWCYPEDKYIDYIQVKCLNIKHNEASSKVIAASEWIETIIDTLRKPINWEIYSYILSHLCPQLGSFYLFQTDLEGICTLHELIKHQLKDGAPIKLPPGLYKSDLQVAFVRTLSSLFPYYQVLGKTKTDDMVQVLLYVLESSFEKTIIPILHVFTISCYEVPYTIKKHLNLILEVTSIRLTNKQAIPSLLEFLIALSDSPEIISPLTLEQLKRVFAIAFKLIEVSQDLKQEAVEGKTRRPSYYDEQEASLDPSTSSFAVTKSLAHFYLTISYQVISHWFIKIALDKRPLIAPFIMNKLSNLPQNNDTEAYKDLVARFTMTDIELRVETVTSDNPHADDPNYSHEHWYYNGRLLSVETEMKNGSSLVVIRGCSGNSVFQIEPIIKKEPVGINLFGFPEVVERKPSNLFTPAHIIGQFNKSGEETSMLRLSDPSLVKSIQLFDNIPIVEFHKIGLVYMAPNDKKENDLLSNTIDKGSYQYNWFVNELGSLIRLKDNDTFYVGGLNPDADGDYALIWHDQKSQIVFHTITLMPNDDALDPDRTMKKRHVGNDFVNVFYDERCDDDSFPFDIIKTQFNFINIVVKPMGTKIATSPDTAVSDLYKVKIYRAKNVPGVFSTSHFKIMHKNRLASYIRHLSMLTNTFAHIWHGAVPLDHCSTWSRRAAHIQTIRTRALDLQAVNE